MALKANFPSDKDSITVTGLYQWDYGQQLEIEAEGLPTVVEVHFSCTNMTEAIVRHCVFEDGIGTVTIPDDCLEQATPITAWIYDFSVTQGKTVKVITLPVIARTRPGVTREMSEDDVDDCAELITRLNQVVADLEAGNIVVKIAENATTANTVTGFTGVVEQATFATTAGSATREHNNEVIHTTYLKITDKPAIAQRYDFNYNCADYIWSNDNDKKMLVGALPTNKDLEDIIAIGFSLAYTEEGATNEHELEAQGIRITGPTLDDPDRVIITCNVSVSGSEYYNSGLGADTLALFGSITIELSRISSGAFYIRFLGTNIQIGRLFEFFNSETMAYEVKKEMRYVAMSDFLSKCVFKDVFIYSF